VRGAVVKVVRQRSVGAAAAIGQFSLQDAGSAGAEEYADAVRTIAVARFQDRLPETVLSQAQAREAVVAAVEAGRAWSGTWPTQVLMTAVSKSQEASPVCWDRSARSMASAPMPALLATAKRLM
jgi:primase-polymerase (primpol)-like protein